MVGWSLRDRHGFLERRVDTVEPKPKMKRKEYVRKMRRLHGGQGGTIKRITERVSPRAFRVVVPIRRAKFTLPDRDEPGDYIEAHLARRRIPTPFSPGSRLPTTRAACTEWRNRWQAPP